MKLASICISTANKKQSIAGKMQAFQFPPRARMLNPKTAPTRTGATAPARVLGRAAKIQAFKELVFTCMGLESLQGEFDDLLYGSGRILAEDVPYHLFRIRFLEPEHYESSESFPGDRTLGG